MKKSQFFSAFLLTACVGVYGSEEVSATDPAHSDSSQVQSERSVSIVSTNEPFLTHPIPQVKAFGALVESVVYKDESRLEVVKVKIKGVLERAGVEELWKSLKYMFDHPTEVGVQFNNEAGLLQIEGIDLQKLQPINEDSRPLDNSFVMNIDLLIEILKLSNVDSLRITVQSDSGLKKLIRTLSDFGSLKKLTINNIGNRLLFDMFGGIFERNCRLEEVKLTSMPELRDAQERIMHEGYESRIMFLKNEHLNWFRSLNNLQLLDLQSIGVSPQLREELFELSTTLPYLNRKNILL